MASNGGSEYFVEANPGKGYELSGKIMLIAIIILFAVIVFMVSFHCYARWYVVSLRRRQHERRRARSAENRRHIVVRVDNQRRPAAAAVADSGLEVSVLNSLPVYVFSSKTQHPPECAVCLSEFEEKEVLRLLPKCSHSFHIDCIDKWFHSHSTCPLCRSPVEAVETENSKNPSPAKPSSSSGAAVEEGSEKVETTLYGGRRKGLDLSVRIEVPPWRADLNDDFPQKLHRIPVTGEHVKIPEKDNQ